MLKIDMTRPLHGSSGAMDLRVDVMIEDQAFIAIAGKSGSGKTTLLRILAGLEGAVGEISVDGQAWLKGTKALKPQKRDIGFVFQDHALFENMSVIQNLLFVAKDSALAQRLLEMTNLTKLADRMPNTLSGGQKQRVSLCRAMMRRPKLLLLDEPLSALDPVMRSQLQHDILTLHKEFKTTSIMVSHDPSEMYRLAQRVIVLEEGVVIADGTPKEVLLQRKGSQKFSFEGELLDVVYVDVIAVAVVAIGQQIVEIVIDEAQAQGLQIGSKVRVGTKAFAPIIV